MRWKAAVLIVGSVVAAACAQEDAEMEEMDMPAAETAEPSGEMAHPAGELSAEEEAAVQEVRALADAWTDLSAARAAGFTNQYPEGCVQTEDGGQGFHFMNDALVDDQVDLRQPELVMFEPQADGSMQLVGVDYVIPFDRWTGAEPPQMLGRPMMRNEPLGVWALHIWTHRDNPSGMFAAFNPNVSCEHASAARM